MVSCFCCKLCWSVGVRQFFFVCLYVPHHERDVLRPISIFCFFLRFLLSLFLFPRARSSMSCNRCIPVYLSVDGSMCQWRQNMNSPTLGRGEIFFWNSSFSSVREKEGERVDITVTELRYLCRVWGERETGKDVILSPWPWPWPCLSWLPRLPLRMTPECCHHNQQQQKRKGG